MDATTTASPCAAAPPQYTRRRPEEGLLYRLIDEHLDHFIAMISQDERGLPQRVIDEFRAYLDCGILERGFILRCCLSCNYFHCLGFSCRLRGFCPSCMSKRSAVVAAHLVDHVIPHVSTRQWVVTLPIHLRYLVAHHREIQKKVHGMINRAISGYYCAFGRSRGGPHAQSGFVSFSQYASSDLSLNPHFHIIYLDGAYGRTSDGTLRFYHSPAPTQADVEKVLATIAATIIAYLIKLGVLSTEAEWLEVPASGTLHEDHPLYARMLHASALGYTTQGAQTFHKVRKLGKGYGYLGESAAFKGPFCARQNGFTIHCARRIKSERRKELEQLIGYVTRPPLSEKRLALLPSGEVEITLKNPYADGTKAIVLTPMGLLSKLSAIIPPAWAHLTRYGGILAPAAKDRAAVVPSPKEAAADPEHLAKGGSYHWAAMLKRIFAVDLTICPRCGSLLKSIAAITDPASIAAILSHSSQGPDPPLPKAA